MVCQHPALTTSSVGSYEGRSIARRPQAVQIGVWGCVNGLVVLRSMTWLGGSRCGWQVCLPWCL